MYKYGKILGIEKIFGSYKPNQIVDCGDYIEIILVDKKNSEVARAKIDREDYGKVRQYRWFLSERGYVRTKFTRNKITKRHRLHRVILGEREGFVTDHINRNPLDNRKENLRFVTSHQNSMNSVLADISSVVLYRGRYRATISYKNKTLSLGNWDSEAEALEIIEKIKTALYGEYKANLE